MKEKKRFTLVLAILVANSLLLSIMPIPFGNNRVTEVFANGMTFSGFGSGTSSDPYEIESVDQLKEIKNYPNSYFQLVRDIDLSTESNWEKLPEFSGVLDGDNHTISNLKIDSSLGYEGLFREMKNATIKNLKIIGASVSSYSEYIGILTGFADNCDIINCQIDGEVRGFGDGGSHVGGIIGTLNGGSIIKSSFVGIVDGNRAVGGIVGDNLQGNIFNCFTSSRNEKDLISGAQPTGGIVGYNNGKLEGCYNTSRVHGNMWMGCDTGGIAGKNDGNIISCYNAGKVDSVAGHKYVSTAGGIAGLNEESIKDCYNTGEVAADITEVYGICRTGNKNATLQNCYNIGVLNGCYEVSIDNSICAYGITNDYASLFNDETNLVENCYYLDNVSEAGKGIILSESAMKLSSSYLGFDFDNIWTSDTTDGFPKLKIFQYFDNSDEDMDSITTVTKIAGSKKNYYGVNYYDNTATGDVYDDSKEFVKAMDYYLSELQKATQKDAKTVKNKKKSSAEKLREKDASSNSKIITMESVLPDAALDSLYEALAQYLDMYVEEGKTLGKIDMSASTIDVSSSIVNKIRNNLDSIDFSRKIGKYTVHFDILNFLGAYTGKVTVQGNGNSYDGVIVSNSKETAKILTEYINTMSEWEEDALYEALTSIFSELSSVTGISDFTENEIKSLLKGKVDLLRNHGYGDLLKYCTKVKEGYNIVNEIISAKDADDLKVVMNEAERFYKKIKNIDYLDTGVTNEIVKLAMNRLNNAKNQMERDLYDYVYSGKINNENWIIKKWNSFKSLFIQCPVNIIIYDDDDNILGQITDTDYTYSNDIYVEVDDDVKTIIIPDDLKTKIKFVGSDVGKMTYVIEQTENGRVVGRANYYDIPLENGKQFLQELDAGSISETFKGEIKSDKESFCPSEYLSVNNKNANVTVQCENTEGGNIIGTGVYPKGEPVVLNAYSDEGYCFKGWYIDEQLQDISSVYRFSASQDIKIKAKFEKIRKRELVYNIEIADKFKDTTDFIVYKNEDETNDILICMAGDTTIRDLSIKLEKVGNGITQIENSEGVTVYDGVSRFLIRAVDVKKTDFLKVYNKKTDDLIGTIYYSKSEKGDDEEVDNGNDNDSIGDSNESGSSSGSIGDSNESGNSGGNIGGTNISSNSGNVNESGNPSDSIDGLNNSENSNIKVFKKGDKFTKGKNTYTVIDSKTKEVSYTKTTSKSSKIIIPATVKSEGMTYKVTKIENNALKNNKYVEKIILGRNIMVIGDKAFERCIKLKSIIITSEVEEIGNKAFYGDNKLTVLVIKSGKLTKKGIKNSLKGSSIYMIKLSGTAKDYYKKYLKYFVKSNSGKTVKIK